MLRKLSLLVSAVFASAEVAPQLDDLDFDNDEFDGTDNDFEGELGEYEGGDDDFDPSSLGALLDQFKGENSENAEAVDQLKALIFSGDESEENTNKIQALFEQILGSQSSVEDNAEL